MSLKHMRILRAPFFPYPFRYTLIGKFRQLEQDAPRLDVPGIGDFPCFLQAEWLNWKWTWRRRSLKHLGAKFQGPLKGTVWDVGIKHLQNVWLSRKVVQQNKSAWSLDWCHENDPWFDFLNISFWVDWFSHGSNGRLGTSTPQILDGNVGITERNNQSAWEDFVWKV